ncbi:MAG: hypothetical protein JW797_10260 [Bradymonadales bacterium]|nr:hypothetical protein [Bradymonadales bacterium]
MDDERYTFFNKLNCLWGDVFIGTALNSPLVVATFVYPRGGGGLDSTVKEVSEHFVGDTTEETMAALTSWLNQEFGPHNYDLQLVMLD